VNTFSAIPAAFDEIAGTYGTTGDNFTATVAGHLVDLSSLIPGEQVLDLCCGPGPVAIKAAKAVAPAGHVTGIDLSARMLERAAAEAARAGVSEYVTFRPGDASRPHGPEGFYDSVLCSLGLYLLPDPGAALVNWRKLITPGGLLAFSWSLAQDPRWLKVFTAIEASNPEPGFLTYTSRLPQADGMQTTLRKLGYQQPVIITETVTTIYDSPEQFWESSLSQGPWVSWRHMAPAQLQAAHDAAMRELAKLAAPDGTLTRHTKIAYATAYQRQAA
jgi:ubiquinone/menaquinone biosynthesis C-methylase UbiE